MQLTDLQKEILEKEISVSAIRSSGPGGQNVNKVSSKIELRWNVIDTSVFEADQKQLLSEKLSGSITREGDLIIVSQEHRSQLKNKEEAFVKFFRLIEKSLTVRKKRTPTKPTAASKLKRVETKKIEGQKKSLRGKIKLNE